MIIEQIDEAIHHDFFSVTGSDIPDGVSFEFATPQGLFQFPAMFVRPHLALLTQLPSDLPIGDAKLRLKTQNGLSSNTLALAIFGEPPRTTRYLQLGENWSEGAPYTIVFVANPAILDANNSTSRADRVINLRSTYHEMVAHCLNQLFCETEDLLRVIGLDVKCRLVSVFKAPDPLKPMPYIIVDNHLKIAELPDIDSTNLNSLLFDEGLSPDIVVVIHGSEISTTPGGIATVDDFDQESVPFTYDDRDYKHGRFPFSPGTIAISIDNPRDVPTVMHEFAHAACEDKNGQITDLHRDDFDDDKLLINKKHRQRPGDPVPLHFATFRGKSYASDRSSFGVRYRDRTSYHPEPIDGAHPNLMDDYHETNTPMKCRFDKLTYDFLRDRLETKLSRSRLIR
jgi:hypothetical protein